MLNGSDTVSIPYQYGSDTRARTVSVSVTDTVSDTVSDLNNEYDLYGEFNNVKLTDEEHAKLVDRFPMDYQDRIEELSVYMSKSGRTYKSHYATILSWDRKAKKEKAQKERAPSHSNDASRWEA